jgi:hypothetical protein
MRDEAADLFERQLEFTSTSPRANALAVFGAVEVLAMKPGTAAAVDALTRWVAAVRVREHPSWPWPEDRLAYDNGRLPEALIAAGAFLHDARLVDDGLRLLDWLVAVETRNEHFSFTPVGGWAPGETRPGFDQQPLEAAAMADACARAWEATGSSRWRDLVLRSADWFLGANDIGVEIYDEETGGGYDGLTPNGPNLNQGAESTLAALSSLQQATRVS